MSLSENDVERMTELSHSLGSFEQGSEKYGNVHQELYILLEKGLRTWIKQNPPGKADYTKDTPDRILYLYQDDLEIAAPRLSRHTVRDILYNSRFHFNKIAKSTVQSLARSATGTERDRVEARYPEYPGLLKEMREAKRAWKEADARIKTTHAFRMMGGLARMGTSEQSRYDHLVKKIQGMERDVLGKLLTSYTKV
jgi:hypothetical protein